LLSLPIIPLWAFAGGSLTLGIGAFAMQFMVLGAWGVVPTYLNELVPANTRADPERVEERKSLLGFSGGLIQLQPEQPDSFF